MKKVDSLTNSFQKFHERILAASAKREKRAAQTSLLVFCRQVLKNPHASYQQLQAAADVLRENGSRKDIELLSKCVKKLRRGTELWTFLQHVRRALQKKYLEWSEIMDEEEALYLEQVLPSLKAGQRGWFVVRLGKVLKKCADYAEANAYYEEMRRTDPTFVALLADIGTERRRGPTDKPPPGRLRGRP